MKRIDTFTIEQLKQKLEIAYDLGDLQDCEKCEDVLRFQKDPVNNCGYCSAIYCPDCKKQIEKCIRCAINYKDLENAKPEDFRLCDECARDIYLKAETHNFCDKCRIYICFECAMDLHSCN